MTRKKEENALEQIAYIINSVDGTEPSEESKRIIHLYASGEIDLETAKSAILGEVPNKVANKPKAE